MRGRIYSDQKCELCGGAFVYDERRHGLFCIKHPNQQASGRYCVQFGRQVRKRFSHFLEAERYLTSLRFYVDEGTFDPRDYYSTKPLGFENQALKWLDVKKNEVKKKSWNNLNDYMRKAISDWGQMSQADWVWRN